MVWSGLGGIGAGRETPESDEIRGANKGPKSPKPYT